MPATAIISDVHGNLEALQAVLADIRLKNIDRIICLGDIIGYGANPCECTDLVRATCAWSLMGNHDFGVLYEPTNFNAAAESSAYWTRDRFDQEPDDDLRRARYEFLGRLRVRVIETCPDGKTPLLAVHGSPRRPINEYIFPDDVTSSPDKLATIFERVPKLCVVGHTHVPGVFTDEPDFYPPGELTDSTYLFNDTEKAVINVGSVGQPRDMDPRASYVVLHERGVTFNRVAYDVETAAAKIRGIPNLPDWLADRLAEGR